MFATSLRSLIFSLAGWCATGAPETCLRPSMVRDVLMDAPDYDKDTRPGIGGPPVKVEIEIYLNSIASISEQLQEIELEGYFRQYWTDGQLARNQSNMTCLPTFEVPMNHWDRIWRPDLFFMTSIKEESGLGLLQIDEAGSIWMSTRFRHIFRCPMDFSNLPFDKQVCRISLSSYSQSDDHIVVKPTADPFQMHDGYAGTTAWKISHLQAVEETVYYGKGAMRKGWSTLHLDLTIGRKPMPQMRWTVGTCVLFFFVSWSGMFISRKVAPARVAMSVIPLLIMLNLTNSVQANLPTIEGWTWLTTFLFCSMCFTTAVIFEFGLVSYLLHLEEVVRVNRFQALQGLASKAMECRRRSSINGEKSQQLSADDVHNMIAKQVCMDDTKPMDMDGVLRGTVDIDDGIEIVDTKLEKKKELALMAEQEADDARQIVQHLFENFAAKNDGAINKQCLRLQLRNYGLYYSPAQVSQMFRSVGVPEGQLMELGHFEEMVVNIKKHLPTNELHPSYFDFPPSLRVDIACRIIFLVLYLLMVSIFLLVASNFGD
eukprot:TRINITY_DN32146_c0_g2_i1.p1 TRINITY_DN32146_c0_g2~~TRINITY_DN32146_c0_g2_i1.p1  ORF type:complete len:543 (-),score=125.34 TRINITY_DN32146_c0_g2_i1:73-1701(-)